MRRRNALAARVETLATALAGGMVMSMLLALTAPMAAATPLFARQTGQPCAACHTSPPELTPFGRQFMLGGYTMTGGTPGVPLSGYLELGATHIARDRADLGPHLGRNDNVLLQRAKLISGGALTAHVGAYAELVYSPQAERLRLGNVDVRAADSTALGGHDLVYGIAVNNNPGFHDPWNASPARSWPYARTTAGPVPKHQPLLEGPLVQRAAGASVYGFVDDAWYAELGAYGGIPRPTQDLLGIEPDLQRRIVGTAALGRVAREMRLPSGSWSVGGSALSTRLDSPGGSEAGGARVRVLGLDLLWHEAHGPHEGTLRLSGQREDWHVDTQADSTIRFDSLKASATWLHGKDKAVTLGHFRRTGPAAPGFWTTASGRPDTAGVQLDAYVINPFFPPPPWHAGMRTRVGATLTHHTVFDGEAGQAADHDTLFVYFLWAL
ncbi:hypothetical protein ACWA7J_11450 [Leptothrix sp. BB-4]